MGSIKYPLTFFEDSVYNKEVRVSDFSCFFVPRIEIAFSLELKEP